MQNMNYLDNYMDKIRFKKRSGMIRRETVLDFWYLYVNGVKNQEYFIEKEMDISYYLIVKKIKKGNTMSVFLGDKIIFYNLYSAKKALLDFIYKMDFLQSVD